MADWDMALELIQEKKENQEHLNRMMEINDGTIEALKKTIETLKSYVDWGKIRAEHRTWNEENKLAERL